jgi:hypothetical protein
VLAALGEAVWSGLVVGLVEWAIDGLFLFFFLDLDIIDVLSTVEVSAVAGYMI